MTLFSKLHIAFWLVSIGVAGGYGICYYHNVLHLPNIFSPSGLIAAAVEAEVARNKIATERYKKAQKTLSDTLASEEKARKSAETDKAGLEKELAEAKASLEKVEARIRHEQIPNDNIDNLKPASTKTPTITITKEEKSDIQIIANIITNKSNTIAMDAFEDLQNIWKLKIKDVTDERDNYKRLYDVTTKINIDLTTTNSTLFDENKTYQQKFDLATNRIKTLSGWKLRFGPGVTVGFIRGFHGSWNPGVAVGFSAIWGF